jgi:lysophospholipase L1-like esterase
MRVLIISDSHGYDMGAAMQAIRKEWIVHSICLGRSSEAVRLCYLSQFQETVEFRPEAVILHIGHNNLWYHHVHNTQPQNIKDYFPFVLSFISLLKGHHPSARIIYSSIYPRSVGPYMNDSERASYNRLAYRYGVLVQSTCKREGISFMLNGTLWISVRKGNENSSYFLSGGLHLNTLGKKAVAEGWIEGVEEDAESSKQC